MGFLRYETEPQSALKSFLSELVSLFVTDGPPLELTLGIAIVFVLLTSAAYVLIK